MALSSFGGKHVCPNCQGLICLPCHASVQVPVALSSFGGKHMHLFLRKDAARLTEDVLTGNATGGVRGFVFVVLFVRVRVSRHGEGCGLVAAHRGRADGECRR